MWTSAPFVAKNSDFLKLMVCPHGQGGVSQCGQGGRGQFFAILYGRPLIVYLCLKRRYQHSNVNVAKNKRLQY